MQTDTYTTAAAALMARARIQASLGGGSPLAKAEGGVVSSHRDPDGRMVALATIGVWLKDCTDAERIALEVEFLHGDLPLDAPTTRVAGARGYRRRTQTKCGVLSRALGYDVSARVFSSLVQRGYNKVQNRMIAAQVLAPEWGV